MKLVCEVLDHDPLNQDDFVDHFHEVDVTNRWTDVSSDAGAAPSLATDGESAVILTTGGTDNNECYITSKRTWDVTANQPIVIEGRVKYTEANTDDANVLFGLVSGASTDALVDNGAGPLASYSGACFYKVDGGTVWNVESSLAGTQTTTATTVTAGGGTYQSLRIEVRPIDSTQAEVVFSIDTAGGNAFQQCLDSTGTPIKHYITYTSFAAAVLALGAKAGGANSETPRFDYVRVSQVL